MAKITEDTRRGRKDRIYLLLQRHENGLRTSEIASNLNYERRTTDKYLAELDMEGKVYKEGQIWFAERWETIALRKIDLEPEEAMVLYLAARLLVKQSDKRNETAETVLMELAHLLASDAGLDNDIYDAAAQLANRPEVDGYADHFRIVMRGYIYRRKLRITYEPYKGKPFKTMFSPYLIEPSAIGYATYAIGYSSAPDALRTYKIGRIIKAELTSDEYAVPDDFPGLDLLQNAWSIYHGEETVSVVLRFHPTVAKRVQESWWHPSQQLAWDENQPGYLQMFINVADTTDFIPWIRSWGLHCEVIEPIELRDFLSGEARKLAELYGWTMYRNAEPDADDPLNIGQTLNDFFGE